MSLELKKFSQIVTIKKGEPITKAEANEGPYPVILGGKEPAYYIDRFNHEGKAIVVSRSGASAGYVSLWNEPIFITDGFLVEPINGNHLEYVYYLLKHYGKILRDLQNGAAIPHVTPKTIYGMRAYVPSFSTQQRIATILSTYDNLIEVNNKRIRVLEQMAENLYKEWFVRFRFPGHETAEFENGIPKGWEKQRIKDFCTFANGFAFKSEEYNEAGKYIVVTIKNVQDGKLDLGSIEKIDFVPDGMPDYCKLSKGDVLMSLTGNVGRVCIVTEDNCLLNQRVSKLISKYPYYTYEFFRQDAMYQVLCNIAYGTAQLNLSPILAGKIKVFMSPAGLQKKYNDLVSPLFQRIRIIADESKNLIKQRDLLLPRLMSGKLEV